MPITIGAKRRWTVLIIVDESDSASICSLVSGEGGAGRGGGV